MGGGVAPEKGALTGPPINRRTPGGRQFFVVRSNRQGGDTINLGRRREGTGRDGLVMSAQCGRRRAAMFEAPAKRKFVPAGLTF